MRMVSIATLLVLPLALTTGCKREPLDGGPPSPVWACPSAPMKLQINDGKRSTTMFALTADGQITSTLHGAKAIGRLDLRGCVVVGGEVAVDRAGDELWTLRQSMKIDGDTLLFGPGGIRIADDGSISATEGSGTEMGRSLGRMRLEGYSPTYQCAGQMMVAMMLASFGGLSMAVSDGGATRQAPPEGSACIELHSKR